MVFNSVADMESAFNIYLNSCKIENTVKMKDGDGCDYLENIVDLNGKNVFTWIKAPSVWGFCVFADIRVNDYYAIRQKKGFKEACKKFENACDAADIDCLYSRESQAGAKWRLQLRGFETDKEKEERLTLKEAREQKKQKHEMDMKSMEIKNKLLEIQLENAKNKGEVDPLITQLIKDINWGE